MRAMGHTHFTFQTECFLRLFFVCLFFVCFNQIFFLSKLVGRMFEVRITAKQFPTAVCLLSSSDNYLVMLISIGAQFHRWWCHCRHCKIVVIISINLDFWLQKLHWTRSSTSNINNISQTLVNVNARSVTQTLSAADLYSPRA